MGKRDYRLAAQGKQAGHVSNLLHDSLGGEALNGGEEPRENVNLVPVLEGSEVYTTE